VEIASLDVSLLDIMPEVPNIPLIGNELTQAQIIVLGSGDTGLINKLLPQLLGSNVDPALIPQIINIIDAGPSPILPASNSPGGSGPGPTQPNNPANPGPVYVTPTASPTTPIFNASQS